MRGTNIEIHVKTRGEICLQRCVRQACAGSPGRQVEVVLIRGILLRAKIYEIFRGLMPIFFIRVSNVVRFSPKRAAAPFWPPTRPLVSFRTRTILSCSSRFLAFAGGKFALLFANSGTEIARVLLRVRITARSTRF